MKMPSEFKHSVFMKHFAAMGFDLTLPGLCAGFAEAARIYFFIGEEKFSRFKQLIEYLAVSTPNELKLKFEAVKNQYINQEELSYDANIIIEIYELFKLISIYSQPKRHKNSLGKIIAQSKVMEITQETERKYFPIFMRDFGGSQKIYSFPLICQQQDKIAIQYLSYLREVAKSVKLLPYPKLSLILENIHHRINLLYDGKLDRWYLSDVEMMDKVGVPIPIDKLSAIIFASIHETNSTLTAFDTAIYTAKKNVGSLQKTLQGINNQYSELFSLKNAFISHELKSSMQTKKTSNGVTYVHLCAKFGYIDLLKRLAKINPMVLDEICMGKFTPLCIAVEQDHQEVVDLLIDKNNQIRMNSSNHQGRSPLYAAAISGKVETIIKLEKAGSRLKPNEFDLFIEECCRFGDFDGLKFCQRVLSKQIDVLIQSKRFPSSKVSPLFIAIYYGQTNLVKYFIKNGAQLILKDVKINAFTIAIENERCEIVKILLENQSVIPDNAWFSLIKLYKKKKIMPQFLTDIFKIKTIRTPKNEIIFNLLYAAVQLADLSGFEQIITRYKPNPAALHEILNYILSSYQIVECPADKSIMVSQRMRIIHYLISHYQIDFNAFLDSQKTILQKAIDTFDVNLINLLLNNGADPRVSDSHRDPLIYAEDLLKKLITEADQSKSRRILKMIQLLKEKQNFLYKNEKLTKFVSAFKMQLESMRNSTHSNQLFLHDSKDQIILHILSNKIFLNPLTFNINEYQVLELVNQLRRELNKKHYYGRLNSLAIFLSTDVSTLNEDLKSDQFWYMVDSVLQRESQTLFVLKKPHMAV